MKLGLAVVAIVLARKAQLKEGANESGEGALPATASSAVQRDPRCPGRGSQVRRDGRSPVGRTQAQEGGCFSAEAPPNLKPDDDKAAARSSRTQN